MKAPKHIKKYCVDRPKKFRLADFDPADTMGMDIDKGEAKTILADDSKRLAELQAMLYAQDCWALLAIFQGMDAAGKDGAIAHVMAGVNPQGCEVHSFKQPSEDELAHPFLWPAASHVPRRGRIGIFNRSHYEEVLVVRVHREYLERQRLPREALSKHIWRDRFKAIRGFEHYLATNGVRIVKFFLHVSKEEQRRRFLARLDEPAKRWKFSMGDVTERKLWPRYMAAYEDMIRHTSTPEAPWYVVPADNKWFARLVVARALVEALEGLDLAYPKIGGARLRELMKVRKALGK
jgi:PPK2 family polyphosphate:nucleotide phosphotransferase